MDLEQQQPIRRGRGRPPKPINQMEMPGGGEGADGSREFVCQLCNKTYLSNPALYLHMKIKH